MGQGPALKRLALAALAALGLASFGLAAAGASDGAAGSTKTGERWVQRALALQFELARDVELRNAPWVGTHNSFNSQAEMGPTLSDQDSNQRITITEQLDAGVRSIELDLHWFPSAQGGGFTAVVCHATDQHVGCTVEKPFAVVLDEIAGWLRENSDQTILLYLEDDLNGGEEAYDASAATLDEKLGEEIYRPAGPGCTELPLSLTRKEARREGGRVIIVSDCGTGEAWQSTVHSWKRGETRNEGQPEDYTDFPDCGLDYDRKTYRRTLIRYYEDSTQLSATAGAAGDPITPETAAQLARCGVDLTGLDQLSGPDDPRLDALVWSWAPGEPGRGRCAVQQVSKKLAFGRWRTRSCGAELPAACSNGSERWIVSGGAVAARDGGVACRASHAEFAVPRTGYEAQLLRLAMEDVGASEVWLGYRKRDGEWIALDRRG